jgi:hypothetical protein
VAIASRKSRTPAASADLAPWCGVATYVTSDTR